ncbi:hypothetical protein GJ496_009516 [Pomphorhynchus laevis]|nr:hypothetical protein GJ496_009516 [Pomphorhynchus laevis]
MHIKRHIHVYSEKLKHTPLDYSGSHLKNIAVILPGMPGTSLKYSNLIKHLIDRQKRVIAIDMPGKLRDCHPLQFYYKLNLKRLLK